MASFPGLRAQHQKRWEKKNQPLIYFYFTDFFSEKERSLLHGLHLDAHDAGVAALGQGAGAKILGAAVEEAGADAVDDERGREHPAEEEDVAKAVPDGGAVPCHGVGGHGEVEEEGDELDHAEGDEC